MMIKPASTSISAVLLDESSRRCACPFPSLNARRVCTHDEMRAAAKENAGADLWIATSGRVISEFIKAVAPAPRLFEWLLVLDRLDEATWPVATSLFRCVTAPGRSGAFLPPHELDEVLAAPNRGDLFIGGSIDRTSQTVSLVRGDSSRLVVPMRAFAPSGDGTRPNFDRFSVIDYGQTLKLGDYEAAADAVLYEYDPQYRKRLNDKRRAEEKGFGPSLRRLRKQKGLKQSDFHPITGKTIARIERGEVEAPHAQTRKVIARKLGVRPDDIETY